MFNIIFSHMATINSGPGAILAPAAGFEDSYAVGFMTYCGRSFLSASPVAAPCNFTSTFSSSSSVS